jgi:large subunit ribosomal protein L15
MKLNELHDNSGAHKRRMRVGRGIGSGKGKTAGRGAKGQKSRTGIAIKGFEGGQMPLYRRLPKRGFNNPLKKNYVEVNIGRLQSAIDTGNLDATQPLDSKILQRAGVISRPLDGIRLLAKGTLSSQITIRVAGASKPAIAAVQNAGGLVIFDTKVDKNTVTIEN